MGFSGIDAQRIDADCDLARLGLVSMIRRTLLFSAFTLGVCGLVFAQQPPSQDDLERLVKAYRVDEAIALIAKDAVYEASLRAPYKSYYACVNRELTPEAFNRLLKYQPQNQPAAPA